MENIDIINTIFYTIFIVFIIWQLTNKYISKKQLDLLIKESYNSKSLDVIEISFLNMTEKIKYSVPNAILRFIGLYIKLFTSLNSVFYRKIVTLDFSENEQIRFIEIKIRKRKLVNIREFDVYRF